MFPGDFTPSPTAAHKILASSSKVTEKLNARRASNSREINENSTHHGRCAGTAETEIKHHLFSQDKLKKRAKNSGCRAAIAVCTQAALPEKAATEVSPIQGKGSSFTTPRIVFSPVNQSNSTD